MNYEKFRREIILVLTQVDLRKKPNTKRKTCFLMESEGLNDYSICSNRMKGESAEQFYVDLQKEISKYITITSNSFTNFKLVRKENKLN